MNLRKLWNEFEQPAALFIGLVIAIVFCWLLYARCTGELDTAIQTSDAAAAPTQEPTPDPSSRPEPAPYSPGDWKTVQDLSLVKGRWEGEQLSVWAEIEGRRGSLYPWRLRLFPEQALSSYSDWNSPIECGVYPRLHQAPQAPPVAAWRVSYCKGGDLPQDGGGRVTKRLLLLVAKKNPDLLTVQLGNEHYAELKRVSAGK